MAIIPEGFAQVNYVFTGTGLPLGAQTTLGLRLDDPGDSPAVVADHARDAWVARILTYQSLNTFLQSVRVKFGPNDTGGFGEVADGNNGDAVGESWAPQISLLIEKVTNAGGRRGRGRMYVPGFVEATVDEGGVIDPANVIAINGALVEFIADLQLDGLQPVLLHSSAPSAPTVISSLLVDPRTATQRRRNRR